MWSCTKEDYWVLYCYWKIKVCESVTIRRGLFPLGQCLTRLTQNILNFSHTVSGTSAKEVMDLIMVTQYFDTIKELGNASKNTTVSYLMVRAI